MLEIKNLNIFYDKLHTLSDINFNFQRGNAVSIIGESGAGKTSLGLSIIGLVNGCCKGEIIWQNKNILTLTKKEHRLMLGKDIAMVFQNVEDALHPLRAAIDQVVESIMIHNNSNKHKARKRARDILKLVGIDEEKSRAYPHQLSGGEKQRVLIAMAIVNDPAILILDEPTASLDAITKFEIIELLNKIRVDKILIVITHDISTAIALTDTTAVLYGGRIVECGNTKMLITNPYHPYTRGLLRSYPNMTTTKDLQGIPGRMERGIDGCVFHPRCTQRIDICNKETPLLCYLGGRKIACHRGGIVPFIKARGLTKSFNSLNVAHKVDLTIYEGETLALVGESGSGKTTLAKMIIGLLKPQTGEIYLEHERIIFRTKKFYSRVQMIFQNPGESISHRMDVLHAVKEPLDVHKRGSEQDRVNMVKKALEDVELSSDDNFLKRYPHHLSIGEVQRVAIARALILKPKLLIADEPTSALDPSIKAKIVKLLLNLQEKRGMALLFITHDIALARKISDRMGVLLKGHIVEEGATSDVINNPLHPYTKNLLNIAPTLDIETNNDNKHFAGSRDISHPKNDKGCPFALRCLFTTDICYKIMPDLKENSKHKAACFNIKNNSTCYRERYALTNADTQKNNDFEVDPV